MRETPQSAEMAQAQAAEVIRRHQMIPYSDGKGGHLFRGATPDELAAALAEAGLLGPADHYGDEPGACRECNGTPESCKRSRIKCCPDCTHTKADLNGGSDD